MSDDGTGREAWDHSPVVSVSFKPEALTSFEQWRWVLVRLGPRRRRPVLRTAVGVVYLLVAAPFLGFVAGMATRPNLQPDSLAWGFFLLSLLFPFRLWAVKSAAIKQIRGLGPLTVEVDEEGVTTRLKNRRSRIDWAGVVEVRRNAWEVVLRYEAGDASWVPTAAFADPDHEARFLQLAEEGLARSRGDRVATSRLAPS